MVSIIKVAEQCNSLTHTLDAKYSIILYIMADFASCLYSRCLIYSDKSLLPVDFHIRVLHSDISLTC